MTHLFISKSGCYIELVHRPQWYVVESLQVIAVSADRVVSAEEALSWALTFWARNYPSINPRIKAVKAACCEGKYYDDK